MPRKGLDCLQSYFWHSKTNTTATFFYEWMNKCFSLSRVCGNLYYLVFCNSDLEINQCNFSWQWLDLTRTSRPTLVVVAEESVLISCIPTWLSNLNFTKIEPDFSCKILQLRSTFSSNKEDKRTSRVLCLSIVGIWRRPGGLDQDILKINLLISSKLLKLFTTLV